MTEKQDKQLHGLARLYKVQTAHYDGFGRRVEPPREAIFSVLRMLGAPVERMEDLADALRQRRQFLWRQTIEPVIVAWDGGPLSFNLRLPGQLAEAPVHHRVVLESGESVDGACRDDVRRRPAQRCIEGVPFVTRRVTLAQPLPFGYHHLYLRIGDLDIESYLFSAPSQTFASGESGAKRWGLFCPLYALASERSWGAGDFTDLESLAAFTGSLGGALVGTLPLLAAFLDEPYNPSPYAPVSRLFWNEFFLDIERIPELPHCPAARSIISTGFVTELNRLRAQPLVDYRQSMALKRRVLEALAGWLLSQASERRACFERFVASHPMAQDYAAFRAKAERERKPWHQWSEAARGGTLRAEDYDESVKQYHLYVQWQAHEQLGALAQKARSGGTALYLDFPLGVNRDGYDVWRERANFALEADGGAPPDGLFIKGQNWGFPPLHPEAIRRQGYRYYIQCLRNHLRYAGLLRLDHVMGLHRLYWIPRGFAACEGVYVHHRPDEFYAIVSLESHRQGAQIAGENLGTVPPYVNAAMAEHKIFGLYVGQFGVGADPQNAISPIPRSAVVSLNTHDTATFAGFWAGGDIRDRVELGLLTEEQAAAERGYRNAQKDALIRYLRSQGRLPDGEADPLAVLKAWLCHLSASGVELLLVNLEDSWLEALPQNVPGTWEERPNWRRKARHGLAAMRSLPSLLDILAAVDHTRQSRR
jgi:4-alpha-glucanotransferase